MVGSSGGRHDGKELWKFKVGSGSSRADDLSRPGRQQYVAVLSGVGGWSGLVVAGDLATDDQPRRWARSALSAS